MNLELLSALFHQLLDNPASLLIILPVSIIAFVLEKWEAFPSRLILPVCLALGSVLFPGLVSSSTVPPSFPSPLLVLILNGFTLGFVAWVTHATVIKWLISRFTPTDQTQKPP